MEKKSGIGPGVGGGVAECCLCCLVLFGIAVICLEGWALCYQQVIHKKKTHTGVNLADTAVPE
jgi:hypothetical protein